MDDDERPVKQMRAAAARKGNLLDGIGVCASATCMIHCLGLPLLLAALPATAAWIDPGESFHAIVLALAVPTSAFALLSGWFRHRAFVPLAIGAAGLTCMAAGLVFANRAAIETGVTVFGSLLLAWAHLVNWRRRRAVGI